MYCFVGPELNKRDTNRYDKRVEEACFLTAYLLTVDISNIDAIICNCNLFDVTHNFVSLYLTFLTEL